MVSSKHTFGLAIQGELASRVGQAFDELTDGLQMLFRRDRTFAELHLERWHWKLIGHPPARSRMQRHSLINQALIRVLKPRPV